MSESRKQLFTVDYETYCIGGLITTDGSGDPTLSDNVGFASVSKTSTGVYKVVLTDRYARLLVASPAIKSTLNSTLGCRVSAHAVTAASPYITVECRQVSVASFMKMQAGTIFHGVVGTAVATANASSEATAVALANALKVAYTAHLASVTTTGADGAHHTVDATAITAATATDEASAITLANELKSDYETHRAAVAYHATADATNAIAADDATDTASLYTLLNEIKADFNLHIAAGLITVSDVVSGEIQLFAMLRRR